VKPTLDRPLSDREPSWRLGDEGGWVERSEQRGGLRRRWLERATPGSLDGAVERRYIDNLDEFRPGGTAKLVLRPRTAAQTNRSSAPLRPVVRMSSNAHRSLRAQRLSGDVESGGTLFGRREGDTFLIEVLAGDRGGDRGKHFVKFNWDHVGQLRRRYREAGLIPLGCWHSHCSRHSVPKPSTQDLRAWLNWYDRGLSDPHIGVIIGRSDDRTLSNKDWEAWSVVTAFVVSRDKQGAPDIAIAHVDLDPTWRL
jgi:Prokaryotic homologs of the JAB domain